jgi:alkanesulfonate monooxygenase SsuD/methylene tetrahydromethanopterin reductase-like flavin-dependent oxidoreductase (luciferase family)
MRVGIVILADDRWSNTRRRWQLAEEYGFAHAWTYDHIGWRDLVNGPWFDAVPTLAAAAAVTSTIGLGTFVASPNFRHPVHFAREITTLDDLSAGRLIVGMGAGGTGYDADVLGRDPLTPRQRADRFVEFVTLLDAILTNDTTTSRGEHYAAVDARRAPGCVQQPRAPFVIAGNGRRTIALAAQHGQGWVTTGGEADSQEGWWGTVADLARRFDDAAEGRPVDRYLSIDAGPVYSLSSVDAFADAVGRATELGFSDVVAHWPRESSWYAGDESTLEQVADLLAH